MQEIQQELGRSHGDHNERINSKPNEAISEEPILVCVHLDPLNCRRSPHV